MKNVHYNFKKEQKSKMGKIAHFSTDHTTCFRKCSYCYGLKIVNMYKASKANYENNTRVLNRGSSLPALPKGSKVVRMYVNGDFHSKHAIREWIALAYVNKDVKFFGYSKQWQNKELLPLLEKLKSLDNVVLRASVDKDTGYKIPSGWSRAGIFEGNGIHLDNKHYYICKFKDNGIKCDKCKICFSSKLSHYAIYFPKH